MLFNYLLPSLSINDEGEESTEDLLSSSNVVSGKSVSRRDPASKNKNTQQASILLTFKGPNGTSEPLPSMNDIQHPLDRAPQPIVNTLVEEKKTLNFERDDDLDHFSEDSKIEFKISNPKSEEQNEKIHTVLGADVVIPKDKKDNFKDDNHEVSSGDATGEVTIVPDKASGNYFSHPSVSLTFTEGGAGVISYCVSYNGPCCDLSVSPFIYSGPIVIGEQGNGQYCLKYSGQTYSGVDIAEKEQQFTIYSTAPATPISATQTLYLQTTQKNTFVFPKITYGEVPTPDLSLSIYNLNSSPSGTCQDIVDSSQPMDLNADGVPDYLDFISYLIGGLDLLLYSQTNSLHYGENYVVSLITKTALDDVRHTCSVSQVHIEDFPIFENYSINRLPASLPLGDETELSGGFSPFGHFSDTDSEGQGKPCFDGLCFGMFGSLY